MFSAVYLRVKIRNMAAPGAFRGLSAVGKVGKIYRGMRIDRIDRGAGC
jgi:hypothetical protein